MNLEPKVNLKEVDNARNTFWQRVFIFGDTKISSSQNNLGVKGHYQIYLKSVLYIVLNSSLFIDGGCLCLEHDCL